MGVKRVISEGGFVGHLSLTVQMYSLEVVALLLAFFCTFTGKSTSKSIKEITHFLLLATLASQVHITIGYWLLLHRIALASARANDARVRLYLIFAHSAPLLFALLNLGMMRKFHAQVNRRQVELVILYTLFYTLCNFLGQRWIGKPIYPGTGLDWDHSTSESLAIVFSTIFFFTGTFIALGKFLAKPKLK